MLSFYPRVVFYPSNKRQYLASMKFCLVCIIFSLFSPIGGFVSTSIVTILNNFASSKLANFDKTFALFFLSRNLDKFKFAKALK